MKKIISIFILLFSLNSFAGTFTITPVGLDSINIGHYFSANVQVSGGRLPYTFSITSGNLPMQGIIFYSNTNGGFFQGTPNLGTAIVTRTVCTVLIRDSYTLTATKTYTLNFTYKRLTALEIDQIWSRSPMPPQYIDVFDTWHYVPLTTNSLTAGGAVTSVNGTTGKITVTGSHTPTVTISSSYLGQTSISVLGDIATGQWDAGYVNTPTLSTSNFYLTDGNQSAGKLLQTDMSGHGTWQTITIPSSFGALNNVQLSNGSGNFTSSDAFNLDPTATILSLGGVGSIGNFEPNYNSDSPALNFTNGVLQYNHIYGTTDLAVQSYGLEIVNTVTNTLPNNGITINTQGSTNSNTGLSISVSGTKAKAINVTGGVTSLLSTTITGSAKITVSLTAVSISASNLFSGVYTPSLSIVANLSSVTPLSCQYMRVGDVVTVSGGLTVDPINTLTQTTVLIRIPIPSTFANLQDAGGTGSAPNISSQVGGVYAGNSYAVYLDWNTVDTSSQNMYFSFTYIIK